MNKHSIIGSVCLIVACAVLLLTSANVPSNYTRTLDVSQFPGADLGAKMLACDTYVAATPGVPSVCDARMLEGTQNWGTSANLAAVSIEYILPNTTVTYAAGVKISLTGHEQWLHGGGVGLTILDGQAWSSGANAKLSLVSAGKNDHITDLTILGDRINSGDNPADGNGGNCITIQSTTDVTLERLYLDNCGNLGISLQDVDRTTVRDVLIEQASDVGIQINMVGGVHTDNLWDHVTCYDCNTSLHSGNGQFNIASSGGIGFNLNWTGRNLTAQNIMNGRSGGTCNQSVTLSARTGCGQGIQVLPKVNQWTLVHPIVKNTAAECIATGGVWGEISDATLDHCNQAGGGGAGCVAIYSDVQPFTGYINVHDMNCTDSGYGVSFIVGVTAAQDGNIFGQIHVHNNNIGTVVDSTNSGIREINSSCAHYTAHVCDTGGCGGGTRACNFSFQNVEVDHNSIRDVNNPFNYAANSRGGGPGSPGPSKEGLTGYWDTHDNVVINSGTSYITDCKVSGASPIQCGGASYGTVTLAAGATTVEVKTTQVTAHSTIELSEQPSLGGQVTPTVTGNTTTGRTYTVTTQTEGVSFVITASAAPVTNPAVISFRVVN